MEGQARVTTGSPSSEHSSSTCAGQGREDDGAVLVVSVELETAPWAASRVQPAALALAPAQQVSHCGWGPSLAMPLGLCPPCAPHVTLAFPCLVF